MMISQKCQYSVRAIFELAKRHGQGPIRINDIAEAQAIPPRFLEVILSQLKQAGFVESRRGNEGGYQLARAPGSITVGEVISFVEGPFGPVGCTTNSSENNCRLHGSCVFLPMWSKVRDAISQIYDQTTFQNLVDEEHKMKASAPSYAI
jgi:Rrf2 family transcriptional regulator, cysteine metabolism repressor